MPPGLLLTMGRVLTGPRTAWCRLVAAAQMDEMKIVHSILSGVNRGTMVDVGAHRGTTLLRFARDGWCVHAFEPDPLNRAELERVTAIFNDVRISPDAVSDESGQHMLYRSDSSTGISSLSPFTETHRAAALVNVTTLQEYLASAGSPAVTFLKVDVEGFELSVLRGFAWARYPSPRAVVVEFEDSKTVPLGYGWQDLAEFLSLQGYQLLVSEWYPVVAYGTTHRWRRFVRYPGELADPDAWGNLIAVRPEEFPRLRRAANRHARRVRVLDRVRRLGVHA